MFLFTEDVLIHGTKFWQVLQKLNPANTFFLYMVNYMHT